VTGFVLLRVRAHRLLLAAALLTVLLTTCVLATFTAFTGAIGDAALRRTLEHQAAGQATVEVQADVTGPQGSALDTAVRRTLGTAFGGLPTRVDASTRSGPYGLPASLRPAGRPKTGDPDLTLLATFDRARLRLTAGHWPAPAAKGASRVQVAMPQAAAQALGTRPGDVLALANRLGGPGLRVEVSGVFRPADPTAPYWHLDPLGGRGVHTVAFTTYGPLLADPRTFAAGAVPAAAMSWQATGDFRTATAGGMDALQEGARRAIAQLRADPATASAQPSSGLPDLIDQLRRSMLVTRSTLLIGALQLVILAAFALLLVAGLLAEERAGETALLRARGGSAGRVARLAATEALLLALPAAVAGPLLAGPVTRLLAGTGAMARTGVHLGGGSTGAAWLVAVCTALACALAVIVPALRTGGSFAAVRAARSRRAALPGILQAGADVGLLVVAGVAYWQLQRRASGSGALSTDAGGGLGVDPVLVAAPALCLLAGTVLVLRLLPLAAKLGERRAARGRGLALALAGWQLARRPRRGAGPAMLLVLAVAMGMFAIGQGASWDRSQRDQAQFAVGADIRVTGMTTPPFGQHGIFASVPDIAAAAPAARTDLSLDGNRQATALAIDTAQAGRAMRFRSDLTGGRPLAALLQPLRKGVRPDGSGYPVPADARRVELTGTLTPDGGSESDSGDGPTHLVATLVDAEGVPYQFAMGDLAPDGAPHPLVLDLAAQSGAAGGAPAGPLRLTRIEATYAVGVRDQAVRLALSAPRAVLRDGSVRPLGEHGAWAAAPSFDDPTLATTSGITAPTTAAPPHLAGGALSAAYRTGAVPEMLGYDQAEATVRLDVDAPPPPPLAAVATADYLKAVGARVGDTVAVEVNGVTAHVRIAASVRAIPGLADTLDTTAAADSTAPGSASGSDTDTGGAAQSGTKDVGGMIVDLRALDTLLEAQDAPTLEPTEWWLSARPGRTARAAAALRARTDVDTLLVADEVAADLRADPLGAGPQSALPAAVVAAAVLAAVGFAVSSAGAVRERAAEFAVLRALGAPRRKLARVIAAEQGLLVLVSLAVGVVLGALLTRLVAPLIVLTSQAAQPTPGLLVELPAGRLAQLLAMVLAVPVLVVLATAARRGDPAAALRRQGED
jgi:hypothetical protein